MARSLAEAPSPTSEKLANQLLGTYAIAVLGLSQRGDDFTVKTAKEILHNTFLRSDPTMSASLTFVQDYTYSEKELRESQWDRDKQRQNELVRAFASEAVAHVASGIEKISTGYRLNPEAVKNTISIGRLNADVNDSNYATVLLEGENRGEYGSFGSEPGLIRELFRFNQKEDDRVMPVLLAHSNVLKEALDVEEGRGIGYEYLRRRIDDGIPHYLKRNDQREINKINVITAMAKSAPALFARLTYHILDTLRDAEYYPGGITYNESTLSGLAEALYAIWEDFPVEYTERIGEIRKILENIDIVKSGASTNVAVKPVIDQLQAIIQQKLS
ncbi:MAG: hypothetical protein V1922_00475 [bacterium]